ncbi:MAG: BrnT family toxin [Rhizobiaceae bacterium]|nr:BrnT family toxin [Rhizobiaceae bacterium]
MRLIAVVYTMRGDICRVISARVARPNEQREYYARYP